MMNKRYLILFSVIMALSLLILSCGTAEKNTSSKNNTTFVPRKSVTVHADASVLTNYTITSGTFLPDVNVRITIMVLNKSGDIYTSKSFSVKSGANGDTPEVVQNVEISPGQSIVVEAKVENDSLQIPSDDEEILYSSPEVERGTVNVRLRLFKLAEQSPTTSPPPSPSRTLTTSSSPTPSPSPSLSPLLAPPQSQSPSPSQSQSPSPSPSRSLEPSQTPSSTTSITYPPKAVSKWDLTGKWRLRVVVDGSGATYDHDWSLTQNGGTLSGSGSQGSNPETITGENGMQANGPITIHSIYRAGDYFWDLSGNIDEKGKLSGTWRDNYKPPHTGKFSSIEGAAKPLP